ncbi:eukaryotic peptide chain release factor GTP-binding subunit ERF3A isoform X2 [Planococcus citri]|uniref:eukaryotic peptide chain release factor GTP-binding subunit ERF3A isoform X2 n=1 Tax=Planococcus citri TaxID=170843 RepID=UPI0031F86482
MSDGNGTPDSWEQTTFQTDTGRNDVTKKISTLNVNAAEFVPNFGSFGSKSDKSTSGTESESEMTRIDVPQESADPAPQPVAGDSAKDNSPSSAIADCWEDAVDSGKLASPKKNNVENNASSSSDKDDNNVEVEEEEEEEEEEEKEDTLGELDKTKARKKVPVQPADAVKKEHVNLVIIGHVDAGKSTIGGQIMALTGMVDKRTLEKYEREAKERSRESWYLSWALDTNQEEREKGKTVEVGRAYFETEKKHFTILDAPGHKSFVPNMIGGAAQADLAVLVISARKGEFETGFDRGGQTREHAMLAKTAGVQHLIVLINKMDDPTVLWSEERYQECHDKILPYLKKLGFNPAKDLSFMPVSGQTGLGLKDPLEPSVCPWWSGRPSFIQFIDQLPALNRRAEAPFVMPIIDKYRDMGTFIMGKVEAGEAKKGQTLLVMPNRTQVVVDQFYCDDLEVNSVAPGENVKAKLKGIEEEDISPGFVLCDLNNPVRVGKIFDAQVVILEHKSIICPGYSPVMHIHCAAEEVVVKTLICLIDKKTGEKSKTRPRFVKQDQVVIMRLECSGIICMEIFKTFPQMGRFILRDEGKTVGVGKVLKIVE